jgi:hypothetical protein
VGQEVLVIGATPTPEQDGWLIHAQIDSLDFAYTLPEEAPETTTGQVEVTEWRDEEPVWITVWAWSDTDALEAFGRIVLLAERGW